MVLLFKERGFMKKHVFKSFILITMLLALSVNVFAAEPKQSTPLTAIQKIFNDRVSDTQVICNTYTKCKYSILLSQFYADNDYQGVWSKDNQLLPIAVDYINQINTAYSDGLDPYDYQLASINKLVTNLNKAQKEDKNSPYIATLLAQLDITLTDSFLTYASDLANGKYNSKVYYPTWEIKKHNINFLKVLSDALSNNNINKAIDALRPPYSGYIKLQHSLALYQQLALDGGWEKINLGGAKTKALKLGSHGKAVTLLKKRLIATGELEDEAELKNDKYDEATLKAVKLYQKNNGLSVTGVVDSITLDELNLSVASRIAEIEKNMDRIRWLPRNLGGRYVWVNIPDYKLDVIESGRIIDTMRVVVGRYLHQSCVLHSTITYLEINPYWLVPHNIGVKELLPKLQKDVNFLARNNIQVFAISDRYYKNPIDPTTVDWADLSTKGFPYKFRQDIGADNSLGHVKFMFSNNCGIYLHDTDRNGKSLFARDYRSLSHGCIRIQKPIDFATYLLKNQTSSATRLERSGILATIDTGKNKRIVLSHPIPVHIVYFTSFVDEDGALQFRPDIYEVDKAVKFAVVLPE